MRLTRRGQVVVVGLLLACVLVALTAVGSHSAATDHPGAPVPTRTVQVGDGDTLWQIAETVAAPGQTRQMVRQIEELNAMTGPGVTAGQTLAVPLR